jgi:hypothetical protein
MFLTGVLVGSIMGAVVCLAAAVFHLVADEADGLAPVQPALVPLHVSGITRVSMN